MARRRIEVIIAGGKGRGNEDLFPGAEVREYRHYGSVTVYFSELPDIRALLPDKVLVISPEEKDAGGLVDLLKKKGFTPTQHEKGTLYEKQ